MSNAPPEKHLKKKRNGLSVTVASIGLWRTIHPVDVYKRQCLYGLAAYGTGTENGDLLRV